MSGSILFSSSEHAPRGRQHYLQHSFYRVSGPTAVSLSSFQRRRLDAFTQHAAGTTGDNSDEDSLSSERAAVPPQIKTYDHKQWKEQLAAANLDPQDVNKLVMDYFAMCGHKDAAEAFARESNTPLPSLSRTIGARDELRRLILDGNVADARKLIMSSFPKVAENQTVVFELLQQEFIELVRLGKPVEALSFSQGELAKLALSKDEFMDSLEQVMLLAFLPGIKDGKLPGNAPKVLNKFWDKEHRTAVHQRVLDSILSAECGRTVPRLPGVLKQLQYEQSRAAKSINFPKMIDLATAAFEPPPNPPPSDSGATTSSNGVVSPSEVGSSASVAALAASLSSAAGASSSAHAALEASIAAAANAAALLASAMSDDPPQLHVQPPLQQPDPEDDPSQQSVTPPDGDDDDDDDDEDSAMVDS